MRIREVCYGIGECSGYGVPPLLRFHQHCLGSTRGLETIALERSKEEQLVFHDRTAEREPELVEADRRLKAIFVVTAGAKSAVRIFRRIRLLIQEILVSIELVVANVFPNRPVKRIGSRFRNQVVDGPSAVSVLRRHVQLELLEFLNRILDGRVYRSAA